MATCTITVIPPPPPLPVEKKIILELTELEARALHRLTSSQYAYPSSEAGRAVRAIFYALQKEGVGVAGRFVISCNGYKIFD